MITSPLTRPICSPVATRLTDGAIGAAAPVEATTWDAANKATQVTLSGSDLIASVSAVGFSGHAGVVGTTSHSTGKRVLRFILNGTADPSESSEEVFGGVCTAALDPQGVDFTGDVNLWGLADDGWSAHEGLTDLGLLQAEGEAMFCFVNFDTGQIWFADESGPNGDPEAGTGEAYTFTPNTELFPLGGGFTLEEGTPVSVTLDPTYSSGTFAAWSS